MTDSNINETPTNIIGEIDYQSASIVSKQIIKKPNGNVTLFAFVKGESLAAHTSPYDALVLILEGNMEITLGETSHNVSGGERLLMPANIMHGLEAKENTKMLLTMIK